MADSPKTYSEEELQALVNQKLEEQKATFDKEKSELAYKLRKEGDEKLEKYKKEQSLTEEERASKLAQEKQEQLNAEITELRAFKRTTLLKERLAKENMPTYFANDSRLINAEDGDLDKAIKVVKGEYEASLPKGNIHSTVVNTANGNTPTAKDTKGVNEFAQALQEVLK